MCTHINSTAIQHTSFKTALAARLNPPPRFATHSPGTVAGSFPHITCVDTCDAIRSYLRVRMAFTDRSDNVSAFRSSFAAP